MIGNLSLNFVIRPIPYLYVYKLVQFVFVFGVDQCWQGRTSCNLRSVKLHIHTLLLCFVQSCRNKYCTITAENHLCKRKRCKEKTISTPIETIILIQAMAESISEFQKRKKGRKVEIFGRIWSNFAMKRSFFVCNTVLQWGNSG